MDRSIAINSSIKANLSRSWNFKLVSRIEINAIIDNKLTIDIDHYENKKNKIPFFAQRDASWIRFFFKNQTHLDLVSSEILIVASQRGVVINLLGDCHEFDDELVAMRIAKYAKAKSIKKISHKIEFNYRRHMNQRIKSEIKEILKTKSNILVNRFDYLNSRRIILKRAIELLIEKKYVEENWTSISNHVSRELGRMYSE